MRNKHLITIFILVLSAACSFGFCAPALAQEAVDDTMLMFVGEELYTISAASRREESVRKAPAAVTVLGRRELKQYRTLAEALDSVPGFYIDHSGVKEQIYLRGVADSFLVMVDGVPLANDSSNVDYPRGLDLSLDYIDKIEIVRGPGSALWGAGEAKDFVLRTYGFAEKSHYHIASADWNGEEYTFKLTRQLPGEEPYNLGSFKLPMPGKHNVSNAAAALAVIDILGIPPKDAAEALAGFHGSERRMEVVFEQNGIVIINDYGHHPTQIAATLAALRQRYPQKKLWAIWEPHTYSRTEMLQDAYARSLQAADEVVITRIYAAREAEHNFDPSQIAAHIPGGKARYLPDFDSLADYVCKNLSGDDMIVVLSAGKGPQISALLQAHISSPKKEAQA